MGSSPAAEEELTRIYQEPSRRPSADEVEAAGESEDSVLAEDEAPPESGVPELKVFDGLLDRASPVPAPSCEPPPPPAGEERVESTPAESVEAVRRTAPRGGFAGGLDDEMVLCEILARLPARSLLRCRAVCTSWRRLISDQAFLLAHHRRQPDLPLIYFRRGSIDCVDAVDLRTSHLRPVVTGYTVIASCDGLLLLSSPNRFYICNPTTNQWSAIPQLVDVDFLGFYKHNPSGEYRLLYGEFHGEEECVYSILKLGSDEPRIITMRMGSETVGQTLAREFLMHARGDGSVLVNGNLHWYLRHKDEGYKIMVFDTDHERSIWACKHRIELPVARIRQFPGCNVEHAGWFAAIVSLEGDVLVRCSNWFFHCDTKGNLLATFQFDGKLPMNCLHRLKESLVLHPFFRM
uniref:F-box domain-containing protein n=1 Tax=Leersia perrieri TaxID=77586 RepID=A0A0D9XJ97_9ORYZ